MITPQKEKLEYYLYYMFMKNKILKFIELLKEAHEDDEQDLNDITLDLKDELIEFEIHKGYFSKQALDKGQQGERIMGILNNNPVYDDDKYCFCIDIPLEQLQDSLKLGDRFGRKSLIKDKKIFTIFRELYQISERYDNCFLHINYKLKEDIQYQLNLYFPSVIIGSLNIDSFPDINQINVILKYNIKDTGLSDTVEIAFT